MAFSQQMKKLCKLVDAETIAVEEFAMSTFKRTRTTVLYDALYCVGVIMALACIAFVLAGNTEALYGLEHARVPLSWVFGGIAVLSFSAAEVCPLPSAHSREAEDGDMEEAYFTAPEYEAIES
jgi:hypothetical protein